ncbi:hypothetical protein R3I93_014944 [Phoxinus phoxinus]|uniref:Uncharacterized protein n=1 Tax=Phoxinus phoxinus TaxID=58324 RepID=A0AAN9H0C3_9TELE
MLELQMCTTELYHQQMKNIQTPKFRMGRTVVLTDTEEETVMLGSPNYTNSDSEEADWLTF